MKDLIRERDKKEKMEHSIVKWWNVHYMTPDELRAAQQAELQPETMRMNAEMSRNDRGGENGQLQLSEDDYLAAQEIIARLQREAEEDEAKKREEIERARQAAENNFNSATGSYSGLYGAGQADLNQDGQIQAILAEKEEALRNLIERTGKQ